MAFVLVLLVVALLFIPIYPVHAHVPGSFSWADWHWRPDVLLVLVDMVLFTLGVGCVYESGAAALLASGSWRFISLVLSP